MSSHTTALVPIEAWCYSSPDLRLRGRHIDVGLFAEALIYYDTLLLNVSNPVQLAQLLEWLEAQDQLPVFLALVREGAVILYDYSFFTAAIESPQGSYSVWNVQDPVQAEQNTFAQRFLYGREIEQAIKGSRRRKALYSAIAGNVIEAKSESFGNAIENARVDYLDPRRSAIIAQAFVDEVYNLRGMGRPPQVSASVVPKPDGSGHTITWNINLAQLAEIAGKELGFHFGVPLTAAAMCNRYLKSAADQGCDLFLSEPMSVLVGDKLYETVRTPARSGEIITELKEQVEFPDVRALVNDGILTFADVLRLRDRAKRFRAWLQSESDRDRDAIIAYHNEVAKESGLARVSRKSLRLFGVLGGGALGGAVGSVIAGPAGAAIGGAAGSGLTFLAELGAKLDEDWRPVVFGDWMRDRIAKLVSDREDG